MARIKPTTRGPATYVRARNARTGKAVCFTVYDIEPDQFRELVEGAIERQSEHAATPQPSAVEHSGLPSRTVKR